MKRYLYSLVQQVNRILSGLYKRGIFFLTLSERLPGKYSPGDLLLQLFVYFFQAIETFMQLLGIQLQLPVFNDELPDSGPRDRDYDINKARAPEEHAAGKHFKRKISVAATG